MSATQVIKGNMFKLVVALTENSVAYADLGTADVVKVKLTSSNGATSLELDDTDANVTVDDPSTGSVSWQLTSAQTVLFTLGVYSLAVQVEWGGNTNILEWIEGSTIEVIKQQI
jgi:hypothetical protein